MEFIEFIGKCILPSILFPLVAGIIWYVVRRVNYLIIKQRGDADKYWDNYWNAKRNAEEERMKDPSYKVQMVWDDHEERDKEIER